MDEPPEATAARAELRRVINFITKKIESLSTLVNDEHALSAAAISITKESPATSALEEILMVSHAQDPTGARDIIKNAQLTVPQRAMGGRDAKKLNIYTTALQETELTTGPMTMSIGGADFKELRELVKINLTDSNNAYMSAFETNIPDVLKFHKKRYGAKPTLAKCQFIYNQALEAQKPWKFTWNAGALDWRTFVIGSKDLNVTYAFLIR